MTYRIGSAQGFYGDDVLRALPMIAAGAVDVICFEALSELTLAILQKDRLANPARGYTFDIPIIASRILPAAYARGIPLITNGGGLNPLAAAQVMRDAAVKAGLHGIRIAAVTGDDILPRLADLQAAGEAFAHLETGHPLAAEHNQAFVTASVYLGALPIVQALQAGAHVVVTGRVADPCLYLAPLIAHYGWAWDDWDRLAAGIAAGHLLECTGQVVGGNSLALIDSITADDLTDPGYPIAEVEADGTFVVTKTPGTGGHVTLETVKEQLLYEIHDPAHYLTPDVTADFTTLTLTPDGADRVRVAGVSGSPRPPRLKANLGRLEGYLRELIFTVGWPAAWRKADLLEAMIRRAWDRLPLQRVAFSYPGIDSLYGAVAPRPADPVEIIVRVVATAADAETLKTAVRRVMANGLSCPPGMSVSGASVGGDARVVLGLWPSLIDRAHLDPQITFYEGA